MDDRYSITHMIFILLNKIHNNKNSSLRIALAYQRKKYLPQNTNFWGQVYSNIMEIEKYYITISMIEKFVLPQRNFSSIKSYLDIVTYWKFWNTKSSERILFESKKFYFSSNKNKRLFYSFLESISSLSLTEISSSLIDPAEIWSFNFSLPTFFYSLINQDYTVKELNLLGNWFNTTSPSYIWINNQDFNLDELINEIKSHTSLISINSVNKSFIVGKGKPIQKYDFFKNGRILIQDLGATIISQLVPKVTGTILDICASPGNKTIQLFDKYEITESCIFIAGDVPGTRFHTLTKRIPLLIPSLSPLKPIPDGDGFQASQGSKIFQLRAWDATNLPFEENFADLVFIDAPCTGSGTMGSKPDVRLLLDSDFLIKHTEVQKKLLTEADRVLKSMGYIFYATCSLINQENEEQIKNFLQKHPNYNVIPLTHPLNSSKLILDGSIKLFPPLSKTEGFFAILLQKN